MALTFIASAEGHNTGSGTTLDTSTTLNVQAGDVIVALCGWAAGSGGTIDVSDASDASNELTALAEAYQDYDNTLYINMNYRLAAESNAAITYRLTLGNSRNYRHLTVLQFRPSAGATCVLETGPASHANTPGYGYQSAMFTTTQTDEILVGGCWASASVLSNFRFATIAATGNVAAVPGAGACRAWYLIATSGKTDTYTNVSGNAPGGAISQALSIYATAGAVTHDLIADPVVTGSPTVGSPALSGSVTLSADELSTGAPTVGAPALTLLRVPVDGNVVVLAPEDRTLNLAAERTTLALAKEYRTIRLVMEDRLVSAGA